MSLSYLWSCEFVTTDTHPIVSIIAAVWTSPSTMISGMETKKRRNLSIPDFLRTSFFTSRGKSPSRKDKTHHEGCHQSNQKKACSQSCCVVKDTNLQQVSNPVQDQSNMPSMSTFAPMMIPLSSFMSASTASTAVGNTSNPQIDAQTALLLAVLRATPNEVFYGLAKDFLWSSYRSLTNTVYNTIQDNITSHLPSVNRRFYRTRTRRSSHGSVTESDDSDSEDSGFGSDRKKRKKISPSSNRRMTAAKSMKSKAPSQLQPKQGDYVVLKAFIKIIIKLYLTLILEVVTLALKFLG